MLNCLKSLHGRFRQFASVIQMFAREREEATPQEITCGREGLPVLSILHWMAPRRAVQQSQTKHCYLQEKGLWNFHWLGDNPVLVFPDILHGQVYGTEEL
jgi:hypothetical protein